MTVKSVKKCATLKVPSIFLYIRVFAKTIFISVRFGEFRRDPDDVRVDRERARTRQSRHLHSQCWTQRQHVSFGRYYSHFQRVL